MLQLLPIKIGFKIKQQKKAFFPLKPLISVTVKDTEYLLEHFRQAFILEIQWKKLNTNKT